MRQVWLFPVLSAMMGRALEATCTGVMLLTTPDPPFPNWPTLPARPTDSEWTKEGGTPQEKRVPAPQQYALPVQEPCVCVCGECGECVRSMLGVKKEKKAQ
jgi:hypothetical protein